MDDLFILALFGSAFGWLYPLIVGVVLTGSVAIRRDFRPRWPYWVSLTAPAATYYLLEYGAGDRQGFNIIYAVGSLITLMVAVVFVAAATCRPSVLLVGSGVGVVAAVILWATVPNQGLTRLL
jgi:hypothetical protein